MSIMSRPVAPAIALVVLGGFLGLRETVPAIGLGALDVSAFLSVVLVFTVLAALVERAVEVLMLIRFRSPRSEEEALLAAHKAARSVDLQLEAERMAHAETMQERMAILSSWEPKSLSDKALAAETAHQSMTPLRTSWAVGFSLTISAVIAANGMLLLTHLVDASADGTFEATDMFRWVDAFVTSLVLAGGAEWFHRLAKSLTPAMEAT